MQCLSLWFYLLTRLWPWACVFPCLSLSLSLGWNFSSPPRCVCCFRLLRVEQTNLSVFASALLWHYFHPCLRLGQQFRIPLRSQTWSVLKRADATTSASPKNLHPSPDSRTVPLLLRIFGRTTGKSVAELCCFLFFCFFMLVVSLMLAQAICICTFFFFLHFSHHVVREKGSFYAVYIY